MSPADPDRVRELSDAINETLAPTPSRVGAKIWRDDGYGRRTGFYPVEGVGKLPAVTSILEAVAKPALVPWAAKLEREMVSRAAADLYEDLPVAGPKMSRAAFLVSLMGDGSRGNYGRLGKVKAHSKALEKAADIGTSVHKMIQWNMRRELLQRVGPEPKLQPAASWAFMAYEDWRRASNLSPIFVEETVFSKRYGYAGTADWAGEIDASGPEGRSRVHVLGDWKTGKSIYPEALLQNSAYVHALVEMGHATPDVGGIIIRLPKVETDPAFEVRLIPPEEQKTLFRTFLHVLELWKWLEEIRQEARR